MASGHYISWQDAQEHLDSRVYDQINIVRLQANVTAAEAKFDASLARQFNVPFTEAENPEAFALARIICAMWAASDYIMAEQQVQGSESQLWYARKLRSDADNLLKMFWLRHHPSDAAPEPTKPLVFKPIASPAPDALFKRSHITPGSSDHW